jgi:hypothetical protein
LLSQLEKASIQSRFSELKNNNKQGSDDELLVKKLLFHALIA